MRNAGRRLVVPFILHVSGGWLMGERVEMQLWHLQEVCMGWVLHELQFWTCDGVYGVKGTSNKC